MQIAGTSLLFSTLPIAIFGCLIPLNAGAQITPDGTTSTTVNQAGNDFTIEDGSRVGDNLFHSFDEFSVPTLGSAVFNNASDIANIFSRVTGSNISNIDGLLSANGAANLFLINPNGIIFGENARLNLGGSFFASTADSLLFEGNTEFSASNPQASPLLEVSIPIGLNFRENPGEIVNRSFAPNSTFTDLVGLEVAPGKNLTLVGGNINFEGGEATARGGRIELGGLSAAGTIGINDDGSLNFPEDVAQADITLSNFADLDVRGAGDGSINISARNVSLEFSQIRAGITADSIAAEAQAGDITINATKNLTIDGSLILNQVFPEAMLNAGDIAINTNSLSLTNGGLVSASTFGQGNAGSVFVNAQSVGLTEGGRIESITTTNGNAGSIAIAAQSVEITGNDPINNLSSGLFSSVGWFGAGISGSTGNGGNLTLETDSLRVTNGGRISADIFGTNTEAKAGSITIKAKSIEIIGENPNNQFLSGIFAAVTPLSSGNAGDVVVETETLLLEDGGFISASTFGEGDAGSLTVKAKLIEIIGLSASNSPSSLRASVDFFGDSRSNGNAGDLAIETETLLVADGAEILVFVDSGSGAVGDINIDTNSISLNNNSSIISDANTNEGKSGDINLNANSIFIANGSDILTQTTGSTNASNIQLEVTESLEIDGIDSSISSQTGGLGNSGNINVNTADLRIVNGGQISANNFIIETFEVSPAGGLIRNILEQPIEGSGNSGTIDIKANYISLEDRGGITTLSSAGEGGDIQIKVENLLSLRNNSEISATAGLEGTSGNGGNINIDSTLVVAFPNQNNDIIANANRGKGGKISITAEALFGIEERPLNPITNDINASSDFGLQGEISVNTPEVDPTSGLIELPETVADASDQILQNPCEQGVGSEFIITGKGGLPLNPNETLNSDETRVGLVEPLTLREGDGETGRRGEEINEGENLILSEKSTSEALPAQGWIFNDRGEVLLTSYKTTDTEIKRSPQKKFNGCSALNYSPLLAEATTYTQVINPWK